MRTNSLVLPDAFINVVISCDAPFFVQTEYQRPCCWNFHIVENFLFVGLWWLVDLCELSWSWELSPKRNIWRKLPDWQFHKTNEDIRKMDLTLICATLQVRHATRVLFAQQQVLFERKMSVYSQGFSFVSDRVIAMSFPSTGMMALYRNPIRVNIILTQFLSLCVELLRK